MLFPNFKSESLIYHNLKNLINEIINGILQCDKQISMTKECLWQTNVKFKDTMKAYFC